MTGRLICDNFLLAQEIVAGMGKKNCGGNVAIKLDRKKAYDRVSWSFCVSWSFLVKGLPAYGYGERFIDMVWRMIS